VPVYDAIIVGLGAMGSAAAFHLASRGRRVIGLDQFGPVHDRGSSHGRSRVIRLAYFEDPAYVPLLRRAYDLWGALERDTDSLLLTITGGLMIGPPESEVVAGTLRSAREHNLPYEWIDADEVRLRFPPFTPAADHVAVYEPRAGVLTPEACIRAYLDRATAASAELRFDERVLGWEANPMGAVRVRTTRGVWEADRLVLAPGAWASDLFDLPELPLEVERQVLYWFEPVGGTAPFRADRCPIYIWDLEEGVLFYGFPAQDGSPGGVKVAFYRSGRVDTCTPATIDRLVHPEEVSAMRRALEGRLPAMAGGELLATATCMYTLTPDQHFVIGVHPRHPQVILASPCSGHGFKFASVIGEILADLAIDGATLHAIDLFAPGRFGVTPAGRPA
jgi:sarcosine oxidase